MALRVKDGREYVLGGRVYGSGETVEGVPMKYIAILTGAKGPLEVADEPIVELQARPAPAPVEDPEADISALRGDYESVVGKRPFMGWGAGELRSRMATYQRRDMTAED